MTLDIPTLMVVAAMGFGLCGCVLVAHWLANFAFHGLGRFAAGMLTVTIAFALLQPSFAVAQSFVMLAGDILIVLGHLWIWFGVADFWQVRSKRQTYSAYGVTLLAAVVLLVNLIKGGAEAERSALVSVFVAVISLGILASLVEALGGRIGLYKGIIKRKTVAAGIAAVLFAIHIVFNFYRSYSLYGMSDQVFLTEPTSISLYSVLEALFFAFAITVTMIVMTTERIQADLRIQAMMDPLTEALNRRAFMTVIRTVLARARRTNEPVSLVMIDIDRFKRINIEHNHLVGDAILSQFAASVTEGRRAQDVFCRFGGEEFVLLLPGTPEEGAMLVAERVRRAVTGVPFVHDGLEIALTVSIGVTTARGEDLTSDSMLDGAYRALKAAQQTGDNEIMAENEGSHAWQ